jgi:hypothetical protein
VYVFAMVMDAMSTAGGAGVVSGMLVVLEVTVVRSVVVFEMAVVRLAVVLCGVVNDT